MRSLQDLAVEGLFIRMASRNMGVFPMRVIGGPGAYEKRTEHMEGWNEAVSELHKNESRLRGWFEALDTSSKDIISDLLIKERIEIHNECNTITLCVNCSDTFYWGCSDFEEVELTELNELLSCYEIAKDWGGDLFACRKREMRPQGACYTKRFPEELHHLFDACGPERDDPDGRKRT